MRVLPLRSEYISTFSFFLLFRLFCKHISVFRCLIYHFALSPDVLEQLGHRVHILPSVVALLGQFS